MPYKKNMNTESELVDDFRGNTFFENKSKPID